MYILQSFVLDIYQLNYINGYGAEERQYVNFISVSSVLIFSLISKVVIVVSYFQIQVSPFLQQMFMPLLHAIFKVLLRPAEENDQSAALEKQMLRRSYFAFLQTVTGSGMSEVIANQGGDVCHA
jgi:uncharacterized membrane protein